MARFVKLTVFTLIAVGLTLLVGGAIREHTPMCLAGFGFLIAAVILDQRPTVRPFAMVAVGVFAVASDAGAWPKMAADNQPNLSAIIDSPQGQMLLAVGDLAVNVRPEDAPFMQYLSVFTVPTDKETARQLGFLFDRATFRRVFRGELNHLQASKQSVLQEVEVDGPQGSYFRTPVTSLIRIDIRSAPNWTRTAWNLVADRDYLFRERPFGTLTNRETTFGRIVTGHAVNEKTLAAGFILNAYQLWRDSLDTTRSQTHYDLLYAHRRHPDADGGFPAFQVVPRDPAVAGAKPQPPAEVPWPGGVWQGADADAGKYFPPNAFPYTRKEDLAAYKKALAAWENAQKEKPVAAVKPTADVIPVAFISVKDAGKGIANFPEAGVDFEKEWGSFVDPKDLKTKLLVDPRVGGVAPGRDSDEKIGSFVALNDRAVVMVNTVWGWGARTFDAKKNVAETDYLEKFGDVSAGKIKADAHELLAIMPNGAQAALLSDAADKRLEVAITEIASILDRKIDGRFVDVRTHQGCIACHAPVGGFISFTEQFDASIKSGIKLNFANKDGTEDTRKRQEFLDFYRGWQKQIKRWRDPYGTFIEEVTVGPDGKSWTGAQYWAESMRARDWYDRPVTLAVAAHEFGIPLPELRRKIFGKKEPDSDPNVRLNQLATDRGIPRTTWQDEVSIKLAVRLDVVNPPDGEAIKVLFRPKLLEDAAIKFNIKLSEIKK